MVDQPESARQHWSTSHRPTARRTMKWTASMLVSPPNLPSLDRIDGDDSSGGEPGESEHERFPQSTTIARRKTQQKLPVLHLHFYDHDQTMGLVRSAPVKASQESHLIQLDGQHSELIQGFGYAILLSVTQNLVLVKTFGQLLVSRKSLEDENRDLKALLPAPLKELLGVMSKSTSPQQVMSPKQGQPIPQENSDNASDRENNNDASIGRHKSAAKMMLRPSRTHAPELRRTVHQAKGA